MELLDINHIGLLLSTLSPPHLVVVLHELYDDPDVVRVVLDRNDPHDVGGVLRVRVLAVLVGQHQASVRLVHLRGQRERKEESGFSLIIRANFTRAVIFDYHMSRKQ